VHDILTDLDGSEQRNTKYLTVPCMYIYSMSGRKLPETRVSWFIHAVFDISRDGPRRHARNGTRHRSGTRRRSGVAVARPR
jgi:hypothetical protein